MCNGMILCLATIGERHETSPSHILASGRSCCRAAGCVGDRTGTDLSDTAGALDRSVRARCATDITARLIGQWLSERLGQQFVIENRPGAGSNIGTEAVVRAAPDGYTLGLFGAPSAINATLYDRLNFNFLRDIAPVAPIVRFPNIMVANPSLPSKTLPEFIAYAKANPGKINMASPGSGSTPHVAGELFKVMTGTNLVHVPYRSVAR